MRKLDTAARCQLRRSWEQVEQRFLFRSTVCFKRDPGADLRLRSAREGLGELQAQSLVSATQRTSSQEGSTNSGGEQSEAIEVDKDTSGVRHNKAENYPRS